jgi:hypothetical protein
MPMRTEAYPPDWKAISLRIRERAGWKCEQCGVPNKAYILRSSVDPARWVREDPEGEYFYLDMQGRGLREAPAEFNDDPDNPGAWKTVILTVHHIGVDKPDGTPGDPHDKMDVRDENLVALCQRCHLLADLPLHIANAKATRNRKRHAAIADAGQRMLFADAETEGA